MFHDQRARSTKRKIGKKMISMIVMKIHFWTELDQVSGNIFDCFEMDEKQNQSPFLANPKKIKFNNNFIVF